tara:strand:+ start:1018 stop:1194 length:177 start_codon:yes stop_codon:yes gene_type:complete
MLNEKSEKLESLDQSWFISTNPNNHSEGLDKKDKKRVKAFRKSRRACTKYNNIKMMEF